MRASTVSETLGPAAGVRSRERARGAETSNVFTLPPRPPATGPAPRDALRRSCLTRAAVVCATAVVAVVVAHQLGAAAVALAAVSWSAVELFTAARARSVRDLAAVAPVVRRHVAYGATACAAGVLLDERGAALEALVVLAALGVAVAAASAATSFEPVRRRLGGQASVVLLADPWSMDDLLADGATGADPVVAHGVVTGAETSTSTGNAASLQAPEDARRLVEDVGATDVLVRLGGPVDAAWVQELGWLLDETGVGLWVASDLRTVAPSSVRVCGPCGTLAFGVLPTRPTAAVRRAKAAVEALVAAVLLIAAMPLLLACAAAIRLDSKGPVIFWQDRVREGGRTFTMVKLRTMHTGAEQRRRELESLNEVGGGLFKIARDPRVTRVGRVLRRLSLDELPQLVHVLTGRMSLIGPRPALPSEVEAYDDRARRRLAVKPGLTGLWQVSGRSSLTWEESVSLDIDYVDNWSAARDLRIAAETLRAVASREGAY